MMELSVKFFEGAPKVPLGELIELTNNVNLHNQFGSSDAMGMTITKEVIPTKANLTGTDLSKFLIVYPEEFVYNPRTHGKKIGLGYNDTDKPFIISWNNASFKVKDKNKLNPYFLYLILSRDEWDREATFRSWGSSTEVFSWTEFCLMKISLPPIEVQREYVAAYKSLQQLAAQNEALAEPLQKACNSYMAKLKTEYPTFAIGDYIEINQEKNKDGLELPFKGIDITKKIVPTSASTDGLDRKKYLVVRKNMMVFSGMQTGRDVSIRLAIHTDDKPVLISSAYTTFTVKDSYILLPEFLYLNFISSEMDRIGWFYSDSSVRSNLDWDRFCEINIPVPPIEVQRSIVALYHCAEEARVIAREAREQLKKLAPAMVQRAANTPVEV